MLDAGRGAGVLYALDVFGGEVGAEDGVLGEVLVGAAADGESLDVDCGSEDDVLAPEAGLTPHAGAVEVGELGRPGGGEC